LRAASFHSIWCHTASTSQNTLCDFERVAFIGCSANENAAVGGYSSFQFREVEFRNNWALRGSALFLNRAKDPHPRACNAPADCNRLEKCIGGICEIEIVIDHCT
jgi:hypothetical protein